MLGVDALFALRDIAGRGGRAGQARLGQSIVDQGVPIGRQFLRLEAQTG